jgi:hypothetical protein
MVSSSCSESESESAMNWWLPPLVIDTWIIPQIVCGEQAYLLTTDPLPDGTSHLGLKITRVVHHKIYANRKLYL